MINSEEVIKEELDGLVVSSNGDEVTVLVANLSSNLSQSDELGGLDGLDGLGGVSEAAVVESQENPVKRTE